MQSQLTRGLKRRVMYVENKGGLIDGVRERIGWVTFSKSGKTVYYRGRELAKARTRNGNFLNVETREHYWISGVKKRGSNAHPAEGAVSTAIDDEAREEFAAIRSR